MGCRGCGKGGVAAIAKESAAIAFRSVHEERAMPKSETTPETLQTPCRNCGTAMEQPVATIHETGRLLYCELCVASLPPQTALRYESRLKAWGRSND